SQGGEFTRVRGSAGTGIRAPDAFEIAFTDNPSLKPERSRSADVGLDHAAAGGRILLESSLFFNTFDDLIIAVGSFQQSSRYRTDNISNARASGLELAGTARGRAGRIALQVRAAYTWLRTEILAADGADEAPSPFIVGDRLPRRPAHQVAIDLAATAGPLNVFVRGGGRSVVRDVDPSFGSFGGVFDAPGYASWDAGASWAVTAPLRVVFRVTNLFDRQYEETLGYPAPGRGAFVGLRVAARR
ncbi:MAG TPA: TonB-dependent receptor, partial [Myxococcota bacterium]|nr:TonB-dependent receptor [Myxococcota bacterium]